MDIVSFIAILIIFLPLIFAVFLSYAKINLIYIKKPVLNNGLLFINLINLCFFAFNFFTRSLTKINIDFSYPIFQTQNIAFKLGCSINAENIKFLFYISIVYFLINIFSVLFFNTYKQYSFTKQRFYIFLSLIIFNTYAFLISPNIFQALLLWILQSGLIFLFAFFDIYKNSINYNITRFYKINLIGDFAFILVALLLFKFNILSQEFIPSHSIDFKNFDELISYAFGISNYVDFKILVICLSITYLNKFSIFPFNCYHSFFANSSNLLYVCLFGVANTIFSLFLLTKTISSFQLFNTFSFYFILYLIISAILALIFILFEKNLKIIFGHLAGAFNSIFMICYILLKCSNNVLNIFLVLNLLFIFIVCLVFLSERINLKKRFLHAKGFLLERIYIYLFETLPNKIGDVFEIIDKNIVQNIISFFIFIFDKICSFLSIKFINKNIFRRLCDVIVLLIVFAILNLLLTGFGGLF